MLGSSKVFASVAVSDLDKAKEFYGGILGLRHVEENQGGVGYESGGGTLFVYQSDTVDTGRATCATWAVNDLEGVVQKLKEKGIEFEHYDFPDGQIQGDIHNMGGMKAAWFKDPDGNILALGNG